MTSRLDELGGAMVASPVAAPSTVGVLAARSRRRRRRRVAAIAAVVAIAAGAGVLAVVRAADDTVRVGVVDHPAVEPRPTVPASVPASTTVPPPGIDRAAVVETDLIPVHRYDPAAGPLGDDPSVCTRPHPAPPAPEEWVAFPDGATVMPETRGLGYRDAIDSVRAAWPHQRVLLGMDFAGNAPEGTVVNSEPEPGTVLDATTIVVLLVAADPARAAPFGTDPSDTPAPMSSRTPGPILSAGLVSSLETSPVTFLGGEVVGCSVNGYGFVWLDQLFVLGESIGIMPDLLGLTLVDARALFPPAQLSVAVGGGCPVEAGTIGRSQMPSGIITDQEPAAGEDLYRGVAIDLEFGCADTG